MIIFILFGSTGYLVIKKYHQVQQENMAKNQQILTLQKSLDIAREEIKIIEAENQNLLNAFSNNIQSPETKCPVNQYYGDSVVIFSENTRVCDWATSGPAKCNKYEKNQYSSIEACALDNNLNL